jgi:hypothetical protein
MPDEGKDELKAATNDDGKCLGCGRKVQLDVPETRKANEPRYRLVGGVVAHDPVACVAGRKTPTYQGTSRTGPPKTIPSRNKDGWRGRRAALVDLGYLRSKVRRV